MALNWRGPPKAVLRAQLAAAMATYKGPVTQCPAGQAWNEGEHENDDDDDDPPPLSAGEGNSRVARGHPAVAVRQRMRRRVATT